MTVERIETYVDTVIHQTGFFVKFFKKVKIGDISNFLIIMSVVNSFESGKLKSMLVWLMKRVIILPLFAQ